MGAVAVGVNVAGDSVAGVGGVDVDGGEEFADVGGGFEG